jgi:hypothetical protein
MERKLIEVTEPNEYGHVGYMFNDSKRWASAKLKEDKKGKYILSKGKKYYI